MRTATVLSLLATMTLVLPATGALAQPRPLTDAECRTLRTRAADHARVSEGVRRLLAGLAPATPAPATPAAVAAPAPAGDRGTAISTRLEQIATERQRLEEQRLGAVVQFNLSRAGQIQAEIQGLDDERTRLERERAALPAAGAPTAAPAPAATPTAAAPSPADGVKCADMPAAWEATVKVRQKELGAREGQAGAVPLVPLRGQDRDQIARELAGQFAVWPEAAAQVGLLDQDVNGKLDGVVDVPAEGLFRLVRERSDGTVSVDVFSLPGAAAAVGETTRRLEETAARQGKRPLQDLAAAQPAGPVRVVSETADFAHARAAYLSGAWADAAKVEGGAARTREFENFRGEKVRVLELIGPATGGVAVRQVTVVTRGAQDLLDETVTIVRPVSFWKTDVEQTSRRETRGATGAVAPVTSGPIKFSLER